MALPMAMGIAQGVFSILGGISANRKNTEAAKAEYSSNKLFIERNQSVAQNSLDYMAQEVNNQVGMALTDLVYSTEVSNAQNRAKRAETGVFGNLAQRKEAVMAIREEMAKDKLIQQGEASMVDVQSKMRELKYKTEDEHHQNLMAYNNRMSQNKSTFDILAGGVSAGVSGYSSGQSLISTQNTIDIQKKQLALLG